MMKNIIECAKLEYFIICYKNKISLLKFKYKIIRCKRVVFALLICLRKVRQVQVDLESI